MKRAPHTPTLRHAHGFSIVELMVSVVIGLLALMFATRMITSGERDKQAALSGSDAMQNGVMAMLSISGDANQAGYGLNDPLLAGCDTSMLDKAGEGYSLAPSTRGGATITPLAPVLIESGGSGADRITFYAGGAMTGTASVRLRQEYTGGTSVAIDREPYGFRADDVIVMAPELAGTKCSLMQLSVTPPPGAANPVLQFDQGGGRRFNSGGTVNNSPVRSRVFNLGPASTLAFHTWSVQDGFLQLTATDLANSEKNGTTVTDNIVSIKAQYGFDTRSGSAFLPENGITVGQWSATIQDADGDGVVGNAGDFQRIAAVRLAVVARSKAPERPNPGKTCDATPSAPQVFKDAQPDGSAATPITITAAVAGDSVDWKCYRYRVFETIVPIRNSAWRPSAWPK
jgi:type IV pilus assembly protein PilW